MLDAEYELSKLVTVETFSSAWEAQLARAALEAEGIDAVIADEHFLGLYGALTSTLGGVRLQVRPEDAGRAADLLRNRRPFLYVVKEEDDLPTLDEWEARYIARVLAYTKGNVSKAAQILGVNRKTISRRQPSQSQKEADADKWDIH